MSGTLNENNEVTKFTDSCYNLKIGKINNFIMIVNIEELNFGHSTSRADLMLLYRNDKNALEIVLFELKNVNARLEGQKIDDIKNRIFNKFNSTMSLFEEKNGRLNSNNKVTKLQGIFSDVVKGTKNKHKTFCLVIPAEFQSQLVKIIFNINEKNKKYFETKFLTEEQVFTH